MKSLKRAYLPLLLAASIGAAAAAPTSPQVVAGQATFSQQGNVFSITNTPNTIINWQSFSINQGEVTRFIQQSADSAVLNRILGQDPTRILGALQSNGKVFLINPNGILFGKDARVDVGGLVASTLDIANADFLAGKKYFKAGANAGDVRNEGAITTAAGGQVFLLAANVENSGVITSPQGDVVLAAGHSVQLVDSRDPDMHVVVSAPSSQSINLGQVIAQGGKIGIYGALVNQRGVVNANSAVVGENGKIVLKASRDTVLEQGSVTSAVGAGIGGEVHVLGQRVALTGDARIDASGAAGGGTVLVGGDYQGANVLLPNARQTWFGKDASIRADAVDSGSGGKVVLWSNDSTSAYGSISARGAGTGNGGQVETSGHYLDVAGIKVNAGGGKGGSWLLDPYDIEVVSSGATATASDVAAFANGAATGVTKVAPSVLAATGTDIVLQAQHDLTVTDAISTAYNVTAQAGNDINVNAALKTTGGNLDFRAGNAFKLGINGKLQGGNYIDLKANSMSLDGTIGSNGSQLPIVSFTTSDAARPITVSDSGADGLWLKAAALKNIGAYELNIGNGSHNGKIRIASSLSTSANLVLENAGAIAIDAPVTLTGAGSQLFASLYTPWGSAGDGITVGAAGSVSAGKSVMLQGDRVTVAGAVTAPAVTLRPNSTHASIMIGSSADGYSLGLTGDTLSHIKTGDLTIGGLPGQLAQMRVMQAVDLSGPGGPARVTLDAAGAELDIDAPFTVGGELALKSDLAIVENSGGAVVADKLGVQGGQVIMTGPNKVGSALAASTNGYIFHFGASGNLAVGAAGGLSGISAPNAEIKLTLADGALTVGQPITTSAAVSIDATGVKGSGTIKAAMVDLRSSAGIGSATAPLVTEAHMLSAYNQGEGANPINIRNTGELVLLKAVQDGAGNGGSITIDNTGGMTVPATIGDSADHGIVRTGSGNIALTTHSPLTIDGSVTTDSGNISLTAGNDGALTVSPGARVASTSGEVNVVAGSTTIAADAIHVASPDKLHLPSNGPPPDTGPTLAACLADASIPGCALVLANAKNECLANPNGPQCSDVLAPLNACIANPKAPGCDAILPTWDTCSTAPTTYGCAPVIAAREALDACIANPKGANCGAILPAWDTCSTAPTTYGCAPVIAARQELDACIANPKGPNCGAILPAWDTCSGAPTTYGCAPVIAARQALDACIANPKGPNCGAILPAWETCNITPSTYGCVPVLAARQALLACIANPKGAGCSGILPTLDACRADASILGCVPVLARASFEACLANPAAPGCAAILPSLPTCKLDRNQEGCSQVLDLAWGFCLAHPNDASCSGILPTISQCIANPAANGCSVVLPTLAQCIGSPTLQGCSVVLPTLAQCAATPSIAGCEAVLPQPDFCGTHPQDATCQVFNGGSGAGSGDGGQGKQVAQAVQVTVNLINSSTPKATQPATATTGTGGTSDGSGNPGKPGDKPAGPAASENSGAKNEKPATKTYCN